MTESMWLEIFIYVWGVLALVITIVLFYITAPYGRHMRDGWGPKISSSLGWLLMEAPSPLLFFLFFMTSERSANAATSIFLLLWMVHYTNRAFVFPFRRKGGLKPMPLLIVGQAIFFNCINAWTCGRWLFGVGPKYDSAWLTDPRFIVGVLLFLAGFGINFVSDEILMKLRKPGETAYKIPTGALYRWVSSPNYFGEILEWWGFALATWSIAPLVFAVWTTANLVPRAVANHRWYQKTFSDYPKDRRAIVPFVY